MCCNALAMSSGFSIRNRIELFEGHLNNQTVTDENVCFSIRNRIELFEGAKSRLGCRVSATVSVSATGSNCLKASGGVTATISITRFSIRNRIELFEGTHSNINLTPLKHVSVSATGSNCLKASSMNNRWIIDDYVSVSATGSNCLKALAASRWRCSPSSFSIRNRIELFEG